MQSVKRQVTYRLYPTPGQVQRLAALLCLHQRVYNAALEQRWTTYARCRQTLTYAQQCREPTAHLATAGV
jgi:putative transposase